MGLPGHRPTSSHKRRRAAHFALKKINLTECPKCKEAILPHRACKNCGMYDGRQVIEIKNPLAKKEAAPKAKKPAAKAKKATATKTKKAAK